jgi:hypothetical protein
VADASAQHQWSRLPVFSTDAVPKRDALELLERRGLVVCYNAGDDCEFWSLTKFGRQELHLIAELGKPRKALEPRVGVPLHELHVFELAARLRQAGWICCTLGKGQRRRGRKKSKVSRPDVLKASVAMQPEDYTHGCECERRWWIHYKQVRFSKFYMVALLDAERLAKPIPHLLSEQFYKCLLDGAVYNPRKGKRQAFKFESGECPQPVSHKPVARRVRPRTRTKVDDGVIDKGPDDEAHDLVSDASDPKPSSISSSQGSGSSGSSSSSSSARVSSQKEGGAPAPEPSSRLPGLHDTTLLWNGFRFTMVKDRVSLNSLLVILLCAKSNTGR